MASVCILEILFLVEEFLAHCHKLFESFHLEVENSMIFVALFKI